MNILVINGPNLNLLSEREPEIYGHESLEELMLWLTTSTDGQAHNFKTVQENSEGRIIDYLHDERHWADGVIINPAAYSHYSYAIRDAIAAVALPTIEVHMTNISDREDFRQLSVVKAVCIAQFCGGGKNAYIEALREMVHFLKERDES